MLRLPVWIQIGFLFVLVSLSMIVASESQETDQSVPEDCYVGELVKFPGPWAFQLGKSGIILVRDQELEDLVNPDKPINVSLSREPQMESLRQICERAQAAGHRTMILAFDHFFSQYRPGQGDQPRRFTPDQDEYIQRIAQISKFAQTYGLGLELSLLSPLEIGPAYRARTGESGVWMHYREGLRDPKSGAYSVQLWRQKKWANNKGAIALEDAGVRVFAFRERPINGTPYRVVEPNSIVEISPTAQVEPWEGLTTSAGDYRGERVHIYGKGRTDIGPLDRVLVVQIYKTPEMDYFSDRAFPFLSDLVDRYLKVGVKLNGLYSDEMHIQQDWGYFSHHDNGELALRYVSDGLAKKYAEKYGDQYKDFAKYLVYFAYGQEDFLNNLSARAESMHVFGSSPEAIRETALFRARYYHLLQDGVVDLFAEAKHYAEKKIGYRLESRAHATWAESPTIDRWDSGQENAFRNQYEYTANFLWSNTVHQAASACYDYFKWGDFLTGNGNDHAECGWLDRDYVGLVLACSTGILNEVPYSYGAHWGMPGEIHRRRDALVNTYGAAGSPAFGMVEEMQHRDVEVLMLYPLDLVSVEERFGSWMTQYGYANLISQDKLLERGKVVKGAIEVAGRRFTTLVALFEPFPTKPLLTLMQNLAESGGRVIWSGPPPVLTREGGNALEAWENLFGVDYTPGQNEGVYAPGRQVIFSGALAEVSPQTILTHLLVDRIYPVAPRPGTHPIARVKNDVIGTIREPPSSGKLVFLGYRPRDDQSCSLGYETRNWFEVLSALGAYPATGRFPGINDNTETLSRTTDYLVCRFPNGTIAVSPHLREVEENWQGGFARDEKSDREYLVKFPPPSDDLHLQNFKVNGHTVSYDGKQAMAFRVNASGALIAFAGHQCRAIEVDGKTFTFSEQPTPFIAWAPVAEARRVSGGAVLQIQANGNGEVRIPVDTFSQELQLFVEGAKPGSRGEPVPSHIENHTLIFSITPAISGRWIYGVEKM